MNRNMENAGFHPKEFGILKCVSECFLNNKALTCTKCNALFKIRESLSNLIRRIELLMKLMSWKIFVSIK